MVSGRITFLVCPVLVILGCSSVYSAVSQPNIRSGPLSLYNEVAAKDVKIVGGYPAAEGEVPWQVALLWFNEQICGGTLLSSDVVLTAAHCMVFDIRYYQVGLGGLNRSDLPFITPVKKVFVHEDYNDVTFDNDIALLILEDPVENFTSLVLPTDLPFGSTDDYESEEVIASGWGTLSSGGMSPEQLQAVQVKVWSQKSCEDAYINETITDNMLCAGVEDLSKDACQGDSGGPLVKVDGEYSEIVGIVSWGIGCADQYPGVYTRVTEYLDWIQDKACEGGSCFEYTTDDPCEDGDCTTDGAAFNMNNMQLLILQISLSLLFFIIQ